VCRSRRVYVLTNIQVYYIYLCVTGFVHKLCRQSDPPSVYSPTSTPEPIIPSFNFTVIILMEFLIIFSNTLRNFLCDFIAVAVESVVWLFSNENRTFLLTYYLNFHENVLVPTIRIVNRRNQYFLS